MKRKYFLVGLVLILVVFLVGCSEVTPPAEILSADIVIADWEQNYYEYSGEWSDLVEVWYKITNTGNVDIDYYKIWFTAYCEDGSSYEDWTNGLAVDVGHYEFDTTWINVGKNKKVTSIKVTDWELTHYTW
jgi:hypothetical protein